MKRRIAILTMLAGCGDGLRVAPCLRDETEPQLERPVLDAPCDLDPAVPTRLLVTTTDFSTGALAVVDLATGIVTADVAPATADAVPFARAGMAALVHRYQYDFVEALDPAAGWRSRGQHAIEDDCVAAPNPHSIAIASDGVAYVPLFGAPRVHVLDLSQVPGEAEVGTIDLSPFADDDGNPEASESVLCGEALFVSVQRLDPEFLPVDEDLLVMIDTGTQRAVDLDPARAGAQGLPLAGTWVRQLRRDPADPGGHTLLALTTGIERIDLEALGVEWAVDETVLAAAGIDQFWMPQAFDVDDAGEIAYLAVYDADYSQVRLWRVGLDGREPASPQPFADGLDSVERTLEVVGDDLWYGSTRLESPGLWRFDLLAEPPSAIEGPLPTGLPPYSMAVMP